MRQAFSILSVFLIFLCGIAWQTPVRAQVAAGPAGFCALPDGAAASMGSRYRRANESIYYVCWPVLGLDARPSGVAWFPGTVQNGTFFLAQPLSGEECTRSPNLAYSVGAVVVFADSTYRCSTLVGPDLKPAGVSWVEVDVSSNDSFEIKGLREYQSQPLGTLGR